MAAGMLVFMGILGIVGGFTSAQTVCAQQEETKKIVEQTKDYIENANTIFNNLQTIDNNVLSSTETLGNQNLASINTLNNMREKYLASMKKKQIGVALIIVVVFMLLLGKKLKLY